MEEEQILLELERLIQVAERLKYKPDVNKSYLNGFVMGLDTLKEYIERGY